MTSFTRALYRRDPAAAEAFHRQSTFEKRAAHGRPGQLTAGFGRRTPTGIVSCAERCSHPGCAQGCTLQGRKMIEDEAERVVSRMISERRHAFLSE